MSGSAERAQTAHRLYEEGRGLMEAGDREAAVGLFQRSLQALPHSRTAELLAACLLQLGKVEDASIFAAAAIGLSPRQQGARLLLARSLARLGEVARALETLDEALELNPQDKAARELREELAGG